MEFYNDFYRRKNKQLAYFLPCKGHIQNPGMGIAAMILSDHMTAATTNEEDAIGHRQPPHWPTDEEIATVLANPMIDHYYIRVGWNDLQQEEGKLTICDRFKNALDAVRKSGKTWSMRVMQESISGPKGNYMPEFLQGKLPVIEMENRGNHGGRNFLPMYTDEYLKYWDEFVALLGAEFDGDPLLECIDVSGYGFWSEGHHCGHKIAAQDMGEGFGSIEEHEHAVDCCIASFKKAFKKTPIAINLHYCDFEAGRRAVAEGAWCRRDSYYEYFKAYEAQYGLMRRPDAAMIYETTVVRRDPPIRDKSSDNRFRSARELPILKCDYGCNYFFIGFNPFEANFAYDNYKEIFEDAANRVGYRLRPSVIWESRAVMTDNSHHMSIGLINDGCANVPGELLITAEVDGKKASLTVNGGEIESRMKIVDMQIPHDFIGKCKLRAYLVNAKGEHPIRWATDCIDGFAPYELTFDITEWYPTPTTDG